MLDNVSMLNAILVDNGWVGCFVPDEYKGVATVICLRRLFTQLQYIMEHWERCDIEVQSGFGSFALG